MAPGGCTVLIVDKRFLRGVYYTTGGGSPTLRAGPARDDVVFVQELLEIYGQVVAVVSGDTALRWVFNHTGDRPILVLVDIDETHDPGHDACGDSSHASSGSDCTLSGPIYTPPASPQRHQAEHDSDGSGPYGLALLRVIAHYVAIGVFRNVAPIAMSTSSDPAFMRQAATTGAMNYLIKPISAETVHSLWLNVFSCRTLSHAAAAPGGYGGPVSPPPEPADGATSRLPQQVVFQRRIRAGAAGTACTADARNPSFEEDFIRQFVPAISTTLPGTSSSAAAAAGCPDFVLDPLARAFGSVADGDAAAAVDGGVDRPTRCHDDDDFITSPRANALRARLLEWAFSPYELDHSELLDCAAIMIMDSAACVDLRLRMTRVRRFVAILESAYYDNPYHNFHHAIDVTQCTFYILHTLGMFNKTGPRRSSLRSPADAQLPLHTILRPTDAMALVVASLCHDLGHPGLNNAFMVRARTQLAELYNDQSVLENFHAACFSMVMSCYFIDFVLPQPGSLPPPPAAFDYEEFRRIAVHAILATDMARHFEFIGKCKAQYERFRSGSNLPLTAQQHEAERAQLAASILKCADISNIVRPFNISQRWTQRLNLEVTLQGNIEESLGLSRSVVVDTANVPSSQITFYETCGRPLFNAVADLVPELRYMADQLENNIRNWTYIRSNQKVPDIPFGLKHASNYDLSISTRAGSTDSAPDCLPKRPSAGVAPPELHFAASSAATAAESEGMANYTLHAGHGSGRTTIDGNIGEDEDDDGCDGLVCIASSGCGSSPSTSAAAAAAAHMFVGAGVSSSPPNHHPATATSS
ncbi:3',5'-cyclic-nucleotide phosphodiesterase [Coemansia biformis]|uniref:Phosphodiesterase n=1 Tax=Coemansia biformis TaxID=1286918 RepID=A0A9W7YBJ7_9FUNG|nr:3',5'-cyclic-nucleotide phosphodiesterase [Coemansia biformis]